MANFKDAICDICKSEESRIDCYEIAYTPSGKQRAKLYEAFTDICPACWNTLKEIPFQEALEYIRAKCGK